MAACGALTEAGFETALLESLADVMILRAPPAYVRSDNGPEFIALALREGIAAVGAKTVCIEPGSLWESGDCESFNSKLRDELLNGEVFFSLAEAQVLIEAWRRHYNVTGVLPPPFRAAAWRRYSERLGAPIRVDHRA